MTFYEIKKTIEDLIKSGKNRFELKIKMGSLAFNDLLTEQSGHRTYHEGGVSEWSSGSDLIIFRTLRKVEIVQDFDIGCNDIQIFMHETVVTQIK
jgi:hypothetical protein